MGGIRLFSMLIVDDEPIEREGIQRLIAKYGFELTTFEAENGKEALEVLERHPIDILFTDIKMPFMDGMELSRRARERDPQLKIIIYSAYGEFEYAKRAISFRISSYVLKPIDLAEFERVMRETMERCEQDREESMRSRLLTEAYRKGVEYEKEKQLLDMLRFGASPAQLEPLDGTDAIPREGPYQLILIDAGPRFFDRRAADVPELLQQIVAGPFDYIDLNESQSVLFLQPPAGGDSAADDAIDRLADRIKSALREAFGETVYLVVGRPVREPDELREEYVRMESMLDNKFFYKDSTVFYTDPESAQRQHDPESLGKLLETIEWHLHAKDEFGFRKGVELFFDTIEGSGQSSAVYVKYMCIELVKHVRDTFRESGEKRTELREFVEDIFACRSLAEVRAKVLAIIDELLRPMRPANPDQKKVVRDIVRLIEEHYMHDIGLSWIASKVYLTETYVSYLFAKETGQTLVKYIAQVRMQKAEELLLSTNRSIASIAEQVGYPNDSYFGKIFKNFHGISPAKFRETRG